MGAKMVEFNGWEMRGGALRIELGPRDVSQGQVTQAGRDQPGKEGKSVVPRAAARQAAQDLLAAIQTALFQRALRFREQHTATPTSYAELAEAVQQGFALAWWCGPEDCETEIKGATKATTRCLPFDQPGGSGRCIRDGRPASRQAVFGRSY